MAGSLPFDARRRLGRTGLEVTPLGFGAMELRGPPRGREIPDEQAREVLNAALDSGINLIDTSIDYGASEELIGRHVAHRRDEFVLAGKCGCLVGWQPVDDRPAAPHDYRRANVVAGVEQSLRRLRTDRIDIMQVHLGPTRTTMERDGVLETLVDLRDQGKVRYLGISSKMSTILEHLEMDVFDVVQLPWSPLQREHEDHLRLLADRDVGVIVRGALAKGAPVRGMRATDPLARVLTHPVVRDALSSAEPTELLVRAALSNPAVGSAIVGTANADHLGRNVRSASSGPLPQAVIELLDEYLPGPTAEGIA